MKTTFVLILGFCTNLLSQNPTFKIDSLLFERMTHIDAETIGFTRESCTGFGVNSSGYLFFTVDSINYLQKYDFQEYPKEELIVYQSVRLDDNKLFNLISSNRKKIKRDKSIRAFAVQTMDENENGVFSTWKPMTSHSCYRRIYLKTNKRKLDKKFNYFDLTYSLGGAEDLLNINYRFNRARHIVQIDSILNNWTERLDHSEKFKVIKD